MKAANASAMMLLALSSAVLAQQPATTAPVPEQVADTAASQAEPTKISERAATLPNRWLLLCCGLPGDADHRERLTAACEKIIAAAEPTLGVPPLQLRVLAGDDEMRDALSEQAKELSVCTSESVANELERLSGIVGTEDSVWVMLLGHAHLYDAKSQFNVLDSDFDQSQFAQWAKPLVCREQVFWLTMPVSGFWIKPLSRPSRVIISATEADLEFTGTEMPYALADVLSGDGQEQTLQDVDQDGSLSLLDLYLATNLEVTGRFRSIDRLQTEHAQLEDNGDGRGTEVQEPYLPIDKQEKDCEDGIDDQEGEETQGLPEEKRAVPDPITSKSLDGFLSRHILLQEAD